MALPGRTAVPPAFLRLAAHPLRWRLLSALAESDLRVRELVIQSGEPQNLVSYHLRLLRDAGLVAARRSSHDARDSYYHLDLGRCAAALTDSGAALHPGLRRPAFAPGPESGEQPSGRPAVLFVCTGNSARSPIAEALLRQRSAGRVDVTSAGSRPRTQLHANTVRVLRERFGVDVAGQRPRALDVVAGRPFDHVVTLCDRARALCPELDHFPRRAHWSIAEPGTAGEDDQASYPAFERTAAEIDARVRFLLPVLAAS